MSRVYFSIFLVYNKNITGGILEEKLYFRPADYGKGLKKHKEKPASAEKQTEDRKSHRARNLVLLLLFLIITAIVIFWLLHGKTTVSGRFPENIKNESLECNIAGLAYLKTNRVVPNSTETKVTMIFYGENEFNSINLRHTMHFPSSIAASEAEAIAHVQIAENFGYSGLSYDEFDNKFTRIDGDLTLSLYSSEKFKKGTMYEYFLVNELPVVGAYPTTLAEFRQNYESQGFTCKSSIDNN